VIGEVNRGWSVTQTMLVYERGAGESNGSTFEPRQLAPDLVELARRVGRTNDPVVRQAIARAHINDYAQFHLGHIITQEGERVAIGKITFDTDHAPLTSDVVAASRHYDNTGSVGAYVRAVNGRLGPWFSGVLKPDLSPEALVSLRANPLSGDWRSLNGNLEMVAALAVPVPGFPIPQLALSAAIEGGVQALILPGYCDCEDEAVTAAYTTSQKRKKKTLTQRMMTAAVLTAERRNALPKSAFALSGRRYPIHDRAHARNALARSSGKPEAAAVRRAVCRRYPDMCS